MLPYTSAYTQFCDPKSKNCRPRWKLRRLRDSFHRRNVSSSRVALKPVYCTLTAATGVPPADGGAPRKPTMGPLLRLGTISVASGTKVSASQKGMPDCPQLCPGGAWLVPPVKSL